MLFTSETMSKVRRLPRHTGRPTKKAATEAPAAVRLVVVARRQPSSAVAHIRIASPPKSALLTRAREKSLAKCNYLWDFLLKFQKKFVSLHTETAKRSLDRALTAL